MDASTSRPGFPTTRWNQIARAVDGDDPDARAALADLCRIYWYPIYAFIRRKGYDAEQALDLTQDYFARLLEKRTVAAADRSKGRFRSFLLRDCSFFLADRIDRDRALEAGSGTARPVDRRRRRREPLSRGTLARPDPRAALRSRLGPGAALPGLRPPGRRLCRVRPRRALRSAQRGAHRRFRGRPSRRGRGPAWDDRGGRPAGRQPAAQALSPGGPRRDRSDPRRPPGGRNHRRDPGSP